MPNALRDLWQDQEGVASVEYALLLAMLIGGAVATLNGLSCKASMAVWRASRIFDHAAKVANK